MTILSSKFYKRDASIVARALLGKILVHETSVGLVSGKIIETEAYLKENDPACHAAKSKTKRNAAMFNEGGTAYVYLIYGVHYCFNVVTGEKGDGEAVLIRAVAPIKGIQIMLEHRQQANLKALASGPGNLCRALAINLKQNGLSLQEKPLYIIDAPEVKEITTTPRIGLSRGKEKLLRYYITRCPYISRS